MRIRHRIPSLFNMSMVDVLCCALGCVILLWLFNSREAKIRYREAGKTRATLEKTEARLAKLKRNLKDLTRRHDSTAASLALRNTQNRQLEEEILDLTSKNSSARTRLAKLTREQRDLLKALADLNLARDADRDKLRRKTLQLRDLEKALAALKTLQSTTAAGLALRLAEKRKLEEEIIDWKAKQTKAETSLVKLTKEQRDLLKELAALKALRVEDRDDLRKKTLEMRDLEKALAVLRADKSDVEKRLRASELLMKSVRADADLVPGLRTEIKDYRGQITRAESRLRALEKDLDTRARDIKEAGRNLASAKRKMLRELEEARVRIEDLQRDNRDLTGRVDIARAAVEKRFAGIALTGKRVVFLIDRSGSMKRIDKNTASPEKWAEVRVTVAKLMQSLPDLEKFQVILFSNKISYLLGDSNRWYDFDPKTSADLVTRALTEIKPLKGTDMHAGLEAAFLFRPLGLDTIYVLSDGLPNMGEGLSTREARRFKAGKQAEILSKYIRVKLKNTWNRPEGGKRVQIHTIGFFYESPDVGSFLWALARENDGSFVGMSRP